MSGAGRPEAAGGFETRPGARPRFDVVSTGESLLLCHVQDADGAVLVERLHPETADALEPPRTVLAGIAGPAYPAACEVGDAVVISIHDARHDDLVLVTSTDDGRSWQTQRLANLGHASGWHDTCAVGETLHLAWASEQHGVLMHARLTRDGEIWELHDPAVIDEEAVSRGASYLNVLQDNGGLVAVYNGAYDGFGQGKSLKLAWLPPTGAAPQTGRIDGPACSVGNLASVARTDARLAILAVDKQGPAFYTVATGSGAGGDRVRPQRSVTAPDPARPVTACALHVSGDRIMAVLQQWPRLVFAPVSTGVDDPTREVIVGGRLGETPPESDLVVITGRSTAHVFFYDPSSRTIRTLPFAENPP